MCLQKLKLADIKMICWWLDILNLHLLSSYADIYFEEQFRSSTNVKIACNTTFHKTDSIMRFYIGFQTCFVDLTKGEWIKWNGCEN